MTTKPKATKPKATKAKPVSVRRAPPGVRWGRAALRRWRREQRRKREG